MPLFFFPPRKRNLIIASSSNFTESSLLLLFSLKPLLESFDYIRISRLFLPLLLAFLSLQQYRNMTQMWSKNSKTENQIKIAIRDHYFISILTCVFWTLSVGNTSYLLETRAKKKLIWFHYPNNGRNMPMKTRNK